MQLEPRFADVPIEQRPREAEKVDDAANHVADDARRASEPGKLKLADMEPDSGELARVSGEPLSWLPERTGAAFTPPLSRMAFNLKKVLKALLYSSSQPLSVKDIQAAFTRFHETAGATLIEEDGKDGASAATETAPAADQETGAATTAEASSETAAPATTTDASALASEPAEVPVESAGDPELYSDVPSLITATQIREAMDQIAEELRAADDGMLLVEGNNGYRIVTHPRFARWIRILRAEPPPMKLNQSSIETLAIIAYRQPVTRGEIETIRGVSAEAGINKLLERELIYVVGRADLPGRPIQYGTTDKFLEFVGVKSLDELPASDVLSSRQIDEWLKTAMNPVQISDKEMGLETEQMSLDSAAESEPEPATSEEPAENPAENAPEQDAGSPAEPERDQT